MAANGQSAGKIRLLRKSSTTIRQGRFGSGMIWPELHGDMQSLARAKPPSTVLILCSVTSAFVAEYK